MVWIRACHIIAMVAWFAGLFYLPRLFVYHARIRETACLQWFTIMEHRLYWFIMTPAAVFTVLFGIWLASYAPHYYLQVRWMQLKLLCVLLLIVFHLFCGQLKNDFLQKRNRHSVLFYRCLNECPTVLLIAIIVLAEVKPF